MKTKQTPSDRSGARWLPGAMALAATTAGSQAATVQITLTGNWIISSLYGGNRLNADLTGDTIADVTLTDSVASEISGGVRVKINGGGTDHYCSAWPMPLGNKIADARFASVWVGPDVVFGYGQQIALTLNGIVFSDARIHGGAVTEGWLEVRAVNAGPRHGVVLSRLIFDDAGTTRPAFDSVPGVQTEWQIAAVPEPGGFLATSLLLGAAGLIRRRQAKAA